MYIKNICLEFIMEEKIKHIGFRVTLKSIPPKSYSNEKIVFVLIQEDSTSSSKINLKYMSSLWNINSTIFGTRQSDSKVHLEWE